MGRLPVHSLSLPSSLNCGCASHPRCGMRPRLTSPPKRRSRCPQPMAGSPATARARPGRAGAPPASTASWWPGARWETAASWRLSCSWLQRQWAPPPAAADCSPPSPPGSCTRIAPFGGAIRVPLRADACNQPWRTACNAHQANGGAGVFGDAAQSKGEVPSSRSELRPGRHAPSWASSFWPA